MKILGKLDNLKQKTKGEIQQIRGGIEEALGYPVRGGTNKLKGKANVFVADTKTKLEKAKI